MAIAFVLAAAACTPHDGARAVSPDAVVTGSDGVDRPLVAIASGSKLTVVTFFSAHCPCQAAHDERLRALHAAYSGAGVAFVSVDAEVSASPARDADEAKARGYPFPIAQDRGGALAKALGAEYATYTVVIDREGRVRYRGGIDSDRTHVSDRGTFYLRDAIEALLAGGTPRVAESKALGCALQTW
jgi:hypothetical protein